MNELELTGKRIAEIRNKCGLTQEKLAEMVNYSSNHIAKLESARTKPSFDLLVNIAIALNVQLRDLFDFDSMNTIEYMKRDLAHTITTADSKIIRLLFKFKNAILK